MIVREEEVTEDVPELNFIEEYKLPQKQLPSMFNLEDDFGDDFNESLMHLEEHQNFDAPELYNPSSHNGRVHYPISNSSAHIKTIIKRLSKRHDFCVETLQMILDSVTSDLGDALKILDATRD